MSEAQYPSVFAIRRKEKAGVWREWFLSLRLVPRHVCLKEAWLVSSGHAWQWCPCASSDDGIPLLKPVAFLSVNKNRSLPGTWHSAFIHSNIYSGASRIRQILFLQEAQGIFKQTDEKINISTEVDKCCDKDLLPVLWEPGEEALGQSRMGRPGRRC